MVFHLKKLHKSEATRKRKISRRIQRPVLLSYVLEARLKQPAGASLKSTWWNGHQMRKEGVVDPMVTLGLASAAEFRLNGLCFYFCGRAGLEDIICKNRKKHLWFFFLFQLWKLVFPSKLESKHPDLTCGFVAQFLCMWKNYGKSKGSSKLKVWPSERHGLDARAVVAGS